MATTNPEVTNTPLKPAKPSVHEHGPIHRLTTGGDPQGAAEEDTKWCTDVAGLLRPRS